MLDTAANLTACYSEGQAKGSECVVVWWGRGGGGGGGGVLGVDPPTTSYPTPPPRPWPWLYIPSPKMADGADTPERHSPTPSPRLSRKTQEEIVAENDAASGEDPENYPLHSPWSFWFDK